MTTEPQPGNPDDIEDGPEIPDLPTDPVVDQPPDEPEE